MSHVGSFYLLFIAFLPTKFSLQDSQKSSGLEVVKRLYDAFSRGDSAGILAQLNDELNWNEAENFMLSDRNPYRSPAEV